MLSFSSTYFDYFRKTIWEVDLQSCSRPYRMLIETLRLLYVLIKDFSEGELTLRAMSLVYTSLLSMVPLLAVSFSVLKAFGVHSQVEPMLLAFVEPLGPKGIEIVNTVIEFVDNVNAGVLGFVGFALLFYTVISLISKIEEAFNHTWRIHSARGFLQRFSYYLSVLLIGPVLIFSAMGVTATMMNTQLVKYVISVEPFGTAFYIAGVLTPYLFTILAFTFVYIFLPNTNVKAVPALIGATAAGLLWKGAGWIFASFVAGSTKYNAIYSSFAVLIMFMIWLYVSWLIFLLGSQITFYYQKPQFIRPAKPSRELSNRIKEKLAFVLMYWIARRFFKGQKPWTLEQLVQKLDVPEIILNNTLNAMQRKGLIVETASDPTTYIPAKDLDRITLYELITVIRKAEEEQIILDEHRLTVPKVDHVITDINRALEQTLNHKTVREWIMEEPTNIAELDKAKDTALPTNQDQDDKERLY